MTTAVRGELRQHEPLAAHTTWRVGGPAARWYRPADRDDLIAFLRGLPADEPLLCLGLGSNVLITDQGFTGTVLSLSGALTALDITATGQVTADAGVPSATVARLTAQAGWAGVEFLAGIPGTIGGALALNAGAWGQETWTTVQRVWTVDRAGQVRERLPAEYHVGYRQVQLRDGGDTAAWFLAAEFALTAADPAQLTARIADIRTRRRANQPTSLPSAGSVFRNPPGDYAGRLIEAAGLKGLRIGDAEVSTLHANFIVNRGRATATDIWQLIQQVRQTVAAQFSVWLQLEIHVIGMELE